MMDDLGEEPRERRRPHREPGGIEVTEGRADIPDRAAHLVLERLVELAAIETRIAHEARALRPLVGEHPEVAEVVTAIGHAAAARRGLLEDRMTILGAAGRTAGGPTPTSSPASTASAALGRIASMLLDVAFGYEAAYLAARLGYDADTCDTLEAQLADSAAAVAAARGALPRLVAAELAEDGTVCSCRCPMCSIGCCGCLRATLLVTELGWTGREPAPSRGLLLLVPPRPGSELAAAGLGEGDRILTADDEPLGTNPDLQVVLRRHEIGEEVRLLVERRSGEQLRLTVRRIA